MHIQSVEGICKTTNRIIFFLKKVHEIFQGLFKKLKTIGGVALSLISVCLSCILL